MRNVRAEEIQGELSGTGIPPLWRHHGAAVLECRAACFLPVWRGSKCGALRLGHVAAFKKGEDHSKLLKPCLEPREQQREALSAGELHL